jgi:hypothetical protein
MNLGEIEYGDVYRIKLETGDLLFVMIVQYICFHNNDEYLDQGNPRCR